MPCLVDVESRVEQRAVIVTHTMMHDDLLASQLLRLPPVQVTRFDRATGPR
jgi:hypothetical protein